MKMQLSEIAKTVSAQNDISAWQTVEISSVAFDSRELKPGALFVPLVGERDGHTFIDKAIENGAAATFWQADHGDVPTDIPVIVVDDALKALQALSKHYLLKINPRVVAITGSNGKTTTKDMVASILATQFNVTKTQDNFNNEIGVPITILSMEPNTEMLVVEMGMDRPGQLDFLSRLVAPDIAIITMIGEAHIEFFGTRDKIADAKMEIVNGLKDDGLFIYDGDEPLLQERAQTVSQRQLTFGHSAEDDVNETAMTPTPVNTTFTTNLWPDTTFDVPMIGDYNVNNALAALCVAKTYRIAPEKATAALLNLDLTRNRAEWVTGSQGEKILSDVYNSNPTAVKEVMAAFTKTPVDGRRLVVLGDMLELGEQSDALHAGLSSAFDPTLVAGVYLVGPHMHALYDQLEKNFDAEQLHFYQVDELGTLSADLLATLTAKDAILIKGSHGIHLETVLASLRTAD
ncbi:UDP-N-acetylmuramoyl-tripeptide--D-alanyl-D-alanine ligase [Secundilactobacillus collinoides]|uniref:UDP-N-acetylmuramoyl-tripeptide--D-alanyl-D-alanine ligase n=2 Tax=Secundilactobacillus collinoides TaxID=33960 RepID=A0A0R2B4D1_SECCO|nr:UDP-N-acetylmuramoyl-tripeptide--D-alanyl-D-alanine ligase [Secundilactobacillus collinoides]KRM73930.1 UDP-N-acetylmuramyl pentapeptide synthase [Secundilactobacillus collinoides DSM 20515 = JCM 1123]KZL41689.1 UDP-N-acetylmuramoyl-tripeptide--D-alanyl-D-alanine ligase [Secundilactobacillus collinoides]